MLTNSEALAVALRHHQAGNLQVAERLYHQILANDKDYSEALHLLGVIALQLRKHEVAVEYIRRAIELKSTDFIYHNNLGNAFQAHGKIEEAVVSFRQALELNPDFPEGHNNLGNALQLQGKVAEAISSYRRALELNPGYADVHNNLGNALLKQGELDQAVGSYSKALKLKPELAEAHNSLGTVFLSQQKLDAAISSFGRALELNSGYAEAYNNLGIAFQAQKKLEAGTNCFLRARELKPGYAEVHYNLGEAFLSQGKLDQAIDCFHRLLELSPNSAKAHNGLGEVFHVQGKLDMAVTHFLRAIELKLDFAEAHSNLGNVFHDQGKLDEAVVCLRRALEIAPNFVEAYCNLGNTFKDQGKLWDAVTHYRKAMELKPESYEIHCGLVFTLAYCPDLDSSTIYEEHCRWSRLWAEPLAKSIVRHTNDENPNRRLRVGYISPDFRKHCQSLFIAPLFSAHDHQHFEIVCYSDVVCPDEFTIQLQSCVDSWRNIVGLTDEEVAHLIRQDRIDILVDLTMHCANGRPLVFARRPAPVQICWLAYPGTTGMTAVEYRLTDPFLDLPGHSDQYYSEESVRLADTFWCYDPLTSEPAVNSLPALRKGNVTFGSLNNFCKVNEGVLKLWAQVLRAVDRSQLMLMAPDGSPRLWVREVLLQHGIESERIIFVSRRGRQQYLELYHHIDIGLDTVPYNGHTTSLDSLWMGVPVVTLVGNTVVGRAGLSQLSNLGLTEFIANSPEEFVRLAVGFAGNLERLSALRRCLRGRMQRSPLMDAPRFARNMEAAYRALWKRWCSPVQ